MPYVPIDPGEKLDYTIDWGDFVDEGGSPSDTISSASWSIDPLNDGSPSEPVLSGETNTVSTATVFVNGCLAGQVYRLTSRIVTAQGRTAERSITLRCDQR